MFQILLAKRSSAVPITPVVIALLINLILLVLGCVMDMAPIILIANSDPSAGSYQYWHQPIQFGIIMVLNCGIGLLTPPVGTCLFISSAIAHLPIEKIAKATRRFICV